MSLILSYLIRSLIWHIPGMRLLATLAVLIAAAGIFLYILYAVGLTSMARNWHVRLPYLSWVPVANMYVLGACADHVREGRMRIWCPALLAGAVAVWLIAGAGGDVLAAGPLLVALAFGFAVAALVFAYMALSRIYKGVTRAGTALLVLSIIFGFLIPVFLFVLRNRLPGGGRAVAADIRGD